MKPQPQSPILLAGFLIALAAATAGGVSHFVQNGLISVRIREHQKDGVHLRLHVPAVVVPMAFAFVPDDALREARTDARRVAPYVRTLTAQLAGYPDFVLANVQANRDTVRVEKVSGKLRIRVNDPGASIDVTLPLRTIQAVMKKLDDGADTI